MTEDEVADKLWAWLSGVMGVPLIYAYQDTKSPPDPYAVMNLTLSGPLREHPTDQAYTKTGASPNEQHRQAPVRPWMFRYSLNVYGKAGQGVLRKVKTASQVLTALEGLAPLTIAETSSIRGVTEILNERYQPRAQMDIEIHAEVRDSLPIDVIETAPFEFGRA